MLNNQNFISKAPEAKVNAEKEKLKNYREQYELTESQLVKLKGERGTDPSFWPVDRKNDNI
jgi:valyl-tRNA synthetase